MKSLKPRYSRILVQRSNVTEYHGIILPENKSESRADVGVVLEVGEECTTIVPGDTVLFGRYAAKEIDTKVLEINGVEIEVQKGCSLIILNEEDVLCSAEDDG